MNPDSIVEAARQGHLYPSVILHGGSEEGRQQLAVRIARTLLCDAAAAERPCGNCRHCTRIIWPGGAREVFHPDFAILQRDLKTATSVDATKGLLQMVQVTPFEARGQVLVIAAAETLSGEAANALLKTLEEPPTGSPRHFLLLTPSQFDLLPTVRSRSMPLFLGSGDGLDEKTVDDLARRFSAPIKAHRQTGSEVYLLAAAAELAAAGSWQDPRAAGPWVLAASAVRRSLDLLPEEESRADLLALAEELLVGWQMRTRGIQAPRILEGLVVKHLGGIGA